MYRGTTPTIVFKVKNDIDFDDLKQVWITLKSLSHELTKTIDELVLNKNDHTIEMYLTQEETLEFGTGKVDVQMRLLTNEGHALASKVKNLRMNPILKEGVIDYERTSTD